MKWKCSLRSSSLRSLASARAAPFGQLFDAKARLMLDLVAWTSNLSHRKTAITSIESWDFRAGDHEGLLAKFD
jgi:hypothetical protein